MSPQKPKPELTEQQVSAQGRELSEAKWELPKKYRLSADLLALEPQELKRRDPEMAAIWERVQADEKRLAASAAMPFEQMSPQDAYRARAAQRAEELRVTISHVDEDLGKALTTGEGDIAELQGAKLALHHRRAEFLSQTGRYDLAASEEPNPEYRDHYLAILDAVWREDDAHCGCPSVRGSGEFSEVTVPSWNAVEEVYSIKHGKIVSLMKCSQPSCGFMNAVVTPAHVKEQRAHRARAARIARGMSPEDAAQTLTAKGHTAAKLLSK